MNIGKKGGIIKNKKDGIWELDNIYLVIIDLKQFLILRQLSEKL